MNQARSIPSQPGRVSFSPAQQERPQTGTQRDDEIDLFALLQTIWRGKWIIAACFVLTTLIGGYYAFVVATRYYTASATVVLDGREEQVVDLANVMSGLSGDQATVNTEVEVLQSRGLATKVVTEMNLLNDAEFNVTLREQSWFSPAGLLALVGLGGDSVQPSDQMIFDKTVDRVLEALSVSNVRQSYVYRITFVTTSPQKSSLMANTLAEVYIDDQLEVKYTATDTAIDWLGNRVSELKATLEESEQAVKDFNAGTDLISPEALEALNRQTKDIRARIDETQLLRQSLQDRLITLEAVRATGDAVLMRDAMDDASLTALVNAGAPQGDIAARLNQIEARTQQDYDRAMGQVRILERSAESLNTRIESQSDELVQLEQLRREAEANATIYAYFLNRLKETEVQRGIQQADSRVLSAAVVRVDPTSPRKPLILILAAMLGLMIGAAIVLAREAAQNTFRTTEDLAERTGTRVLGTVPRIPVRKRAKIIEYMLNKPTSSAAEAIRNLRTSLMLSNVDEPPQVILSTSSIPSEGKTTLSILMAQNLAAVGKKVLLIEGDMRRRVFSSYFDIPGDIGLVGVLTGDVKLEQAVSHEPSLGIDILPSEKPNVNAADLYASERFAEMLADMRARYDIIILDTPPVLVVPDARVAARHVDAVMFSVRWDSTSKQQVRAGIDMFASVGINVTGLVLGQVDPRGLKRYGYGQYGGYGGNYGGYYQN